MKKGLLYIVLFTYASLVCKPALPYFADIIGHTLFYHDHMATVHFEDGKLHVHKELLKEHKNKNQNDKPLQLKKDSQPNDHINPGLQVPSLPEDFYRVYHSAYTSSYPPAIIPIYLPPPRPLA